MKHFLIAGLAYIAAALDTFPWHAPLRPDMIAVLAAVLVVTLPCRTAMVWAAALGLLADLIGTASLGTSLLCYSFAALAIRASLSGVPERPLHVACLACLGFLTLATGGSLLLGQLFAGLPAPELRGAVMTTAVTWLLTVALVSVTRGITWCRERLRKPPTTGGAVGTPVGLSVQ